MSKNNIRSKPTILVFIGVTLILLSIPGFAKGPQSETAKLRREVIDRLSVLELMDGKTEKSVTLQKMAMKKTESEAENFSDIALYGKDLTDQLKAKGRTAEAAKIEEKIMAVFNEKKPDFPAPAEQARTPVIIDEPAASPIPETPYYGMPNLPEPAPVAKPAPKAKPEAPRAAPVVQPVAEKKALLTAPVAPAASAPVKPAPVVSAPKPASVMPDPKPAPVAAPRKPAPVVVERRVEVVRTVKAPENKPASLPQNVEKEIVIVKEVRAPASGTKRVAAVTPQYRIVKITEKETVPAKQNALSQPLLPPTGNKAVREETPMKPVTLSRKDPNQLKHYSTIQVTMDFRDVEIADIVRLLASKANLNVVSRNPIRGRTTVNFEAILVGTALDTVLRTNDYSYDLKDGVIWVYKVGEEPLETRVFFVKNAYAADIAPLVKNCLSELFVPSAQPTGTSGTSANQGSQGSTGNAPGSQSPSPDVQQSPTSQGGDMGGIGGPGAPAGLPPAGGPGMGAPGGYENAPMGGPGNAPGGQQGQPGGAPVSGAPMAGQSGTGSPQGSPGTSGSGASGMAPATSNRWNVQVDDRSNSLIVTASKTKLDEVAKLVEVFDVPLEGGKSSERVFKVKYIDRTTLEKAIKMVIPRFDAQKQLINVTRTDGAQSSGNSGSSSGGSSGSSTGGSTGGSYQSGS